jgi:hypothetical protein
MSALNHEKLAPFYDALVVSDHDLTFFIEACRLSDICRQHRGGFEITNWPSITPR